MASAKETQRSKLIRIILIVILLLGVFLITVEIILAQKGTVIYSGIERYVRLRENNPSVSQTYIPTKDNLELTDNLQVKPYTIRIDADGYVLPSKIHDNPDVQIVFLGGSTTACLWMAEENRFPYLTGRLVKRAPI